MIDVSILAGAALIIITIKKVLIELILIKKQVSCSRNVNRMG